MNLPLFPAKVVCLLLAPVAIALAALWLCLARIGTAEKTADVLAARTAVAAENARELERGVLLSAYSLRGYVASGEKAYLDKAKKELAQAMQALHDLRGDEAAAPALDAETTARPAPAVSSPPATKAADAASSDNAPSPLERAGYLFDAYKKQAELAVALYEALGASRADFVEAADAFGAAARELENAAQSLADQGMNVKYPVIERVKLRLAQAAAARAAAASGAAVSAAYAKARVERRPAILREASPEFEKAASALTAASSGQEAQAEFQPGPALAALEEYQAKTAALLQEWRDLESAGEKLVGDEKAVLEAASSLALDRGEALTRQTEALASSLAWSRGFAMAAVVGMGIFGVAWAVFGAMFWAGPVARCSRFAQALVKGDLRPELDVVSRDELGALAGALRELARRMGRTFAR